MTHPARDVVITGMGAACALGMELSSLRRALAEGTCGIRRLTSLDASALAVPCGSELAWRAVDAALDSWEYRPFDRTADVAVYAAGQALISAGLWEPGHAVTEPETAAIFGVGAGSCHSLYAAAQGLFTRGPRGVRPTSVPRAMANATSAQVSIFFGLHGPNFVVASACASALTALGIACRMIRHGHSDRVLCGGSEAPFDPLTYAGWVNLRILSRSPDPHRACRPFDRNRDGFVLGEGAGALLLESRESADARGAPIHAVVRGFGESSDATHITRPDPVGQAAAMRRALADAGLLPSDIGYINAHGTATEVSDASEAESIRAVFGDPANQPPVSSGKSYIGHTLGASGALESIMTILALEAQAAPPNLGLDTPDPALPVRAVRGAPAPIASPFALKNSFGFGGNNVSAVLEIPR